MTGQTKLMLKLRLLDGKRVASVRKQSSVKSGYYPVDSIKAILALMTTMLTMMTPGNNADNNDNWQQ